MKGSTVARLLALLVLGGVLGGACVASSAVRAAPFPDRPIRWIVPYPPGGTTDIIARNVAQAISQAHGYTIVVDNRAGAGGQIAMNAVAQAAPDGYTLLVSDASLATAPSLYKQLSFDPIKDLQAVALFATVPHIVVVNPAVQASSLGELIALSKKAAGELNFGSGGVGSPLHLAGEALRVESGIAWTHIPYKGAGPAILAATSGEVQIATPSLPAALSLVRAGKLRALAVMSPERLAALPDVPTVAEAGYLKATVLGWVGLHAPVATPVDVLGTLEAAASKALQGSDLRERLAMQGADVAALSGAAYGKLVLNEAGRWKEIVRAAGIPAQ
jgi:tripartite-type tricarboxylate transporter receptor subunit TctC